MCAVRAVMNNREAARTAKQEDEEKAYDGHDASEQAIARIDLWVDHHVASLVAIGALDVRLQIGVPVPPIVHVLSSVVVVRHHYLCVVVHNNNWPVIKGQSVKGLVLVVVVDGNGSFCLRSECGVGSVIHLLGHRVVSLKHWRLVHVLGLESRRVELVLRVRKLVEGSLNLRSVVVLLHR